MPSCFPLARESGNHQARLYLASPLPQGHTLFLLDVFVNSLPGIFSGSDFFRQHFRQVENMKKILLIPVMLGLVLRSSACSSATGDTARVSTKRSVHTPEQTRTSEHSEKSTDMKLIITTDKEMIHARLYDNAAAKDFIAMLPITLTLEDYNRTEKIAGLPKRLSTSGAPDGYTPHRSDIAFYVP